MPRAELIDLGERRKILTDRERKDARAAGRQEEACAEADRRDRYHAVRMRVHFRWARIGILATFLLVILLVTNVLPPLHDFLLPLIGGSTVFTVFHAYCWDRHWEAP